jgi:hypothetical protein
MMAGQGDIALALMVELAGVVILTLVAGVSDEAAGLIIVFLIGLWLLWLIKHAEFSGWINGLFGRVQKATAG